MANIPPDIRRMWKVDSIIITVTNYKYTPGKAGMKNQMKQKEYADFSIFMANVLVDEFVRAIDQQRYVSGSHAWKPLSLKYRTWKQAHNLSTNIWEATGHMKNNIKMFRKGKYIYVGFKPTDMYPKSLAKVNDIARYLEYGGKSNPNRPPSRPLWRPLMERIRKDSGRWVKKYKTLLEKSGKRYLYL